MCARISLPAGSCARTEDGGLSWRTDVWCQVHALLGWRQFSRERLLVVGATDDVATESLDVISCHHRLRDLDVQGAASGKVLYCLILTEPTYPEGVSRFDRDTALRERPSD